MKNLVFIILITTSLLSAQQITIKGIITDSRTARPLFGANISLLESSSIGTTSQKDGKFILNDVAINSILKISYVGYTDRYFTVTTSAAGKEVLITLEQFVKK